MKRFLNYKYKDFHEFVTTRAFLFDARKPYFSEMERVSSEIREEINKLKSDDIKDIAPWAIFGDLDRTQNSG